MLTYERAKSLFDTARNPDAGKPLGERGTILRKEKNDYVVSYHGTPVVTIHPDGTYTLRVDGWHTLTTRKRINDYSPARVCAKRGVTYIRVGADWDNVVPMPDGAKVRQDGTLILESVPDAERDEHFIKFLDKLIHKYVKGFCAEIQSGALDVTDTGGDCLFCRVGGFGDVAHVVSHLHEGYHVPSLLIRALHSQYAASPQSAGNLLYLIKERKDLGFVRFALKHYFGKNRAALLVALKNNPTGV